MNLQVQHNLLEGAEELHYSTGLENDSLPYFSFDLQVVNQLFSA
jgi:hypothetical protein